MLVFVAGRKPENPRKKNLGTRQGTTRNSTHVWHWAGIEPRPQWWDESAPTIPALHKEVIIFISTIEENRLLLFTVNAFKNLDYKILL